MSTPADMFDSDGMARQLGNAVVGALMAREQAGLAVTDTELLVRETNIGPDMFGGCGVVPGHAIHEFFGPEAAADVARRLHDVVESGRVLLFLEVRSSLADGRGRPRVFSLSAARLEDDEGKPSGLVVDVSDVSEQHHARLRAELLYRAADRIGNSLDVSRTAQELADLLTPSLGGLTQVFLAEAVLIGEEASDVPDGPLRCTAVRAQGPWPDLMIQPDRPLPPLPRTGSVLDTLHAGRAWVTDADELTHILRDDPHLAAALIPPGGHSALIAPLHARGRTLGGVIVWRLRDEPKFDAEDPRLLFQIATRAALGLDNARRYTREHRAAVTLQRSLLPAPATQATAVHTAGVYRPASSAPIIGGDWFDVITLSSLRVALVVGDVVGHGLQAAATMGRLRAALHTLAGLDLAPDEALTHLDDLVQHLMAEGADEGREGIGATCLYSVYDPVTRGWTLASAGHPPPALTRPDGATEFIDLPPGPPLGVGGVPFEVVEMSLDPGSLLALYTDGLVVRDDRDIDAGMRALAAALAGTAAVDSDLPELANRLTSRLTDSQSRDDVALLLARTRTVDAESVASWEFAADARLAAQARAAAAAQLRAWGLPDLCFSTELIVSELFSNAVRYAGGPVTLQLIRDQVLICEVSDPSNSQPRLRRASPTDEGGRGMFLIAQLTTRWGSRYGPHGKTIWTEQSLTGD